MPASVLLRAAAGLSGTAAVLLALLAPGAAADDRADDRADDPAAAPDYRFLSSPDFLNTDVADLTGLPTWRRGLPEGTSADHEAALSVVLDTWVAEQPQDVLVAGDLVEGHWGMDTDGTGLFGPVRTERQQRRAVTRAAHSYYPAWLERFADHGLPVPHTAVGDHELGDDPWRAASRDRPGFKWRALERFRRLYADALVAPHGYASHPADGQARRTAYATRPSPEVQLVTLDVFTRTRSGVRARIDAAQLAWLRRTLARAERDAVDWVVVQGHTPVLGPVRQVASSGLMYDGGRGSALWRTLVAHDVDLYLAGEVHDVTAVRDRGVTQVSHGGLFGWGGTSYLVGEVRGDELSLVARRFEASYDATERLWVTDPRKSPPARLTYRPDPPVVGTMRLTAAGRVLGRTGLLEPYRPRDDAARSSVDAPRGFRE